MGKHRAEPPPRVRPRLGRLAAATLALSVTGVALLSGIGVINLDVDSVSASPKSPVSANGSASSDAGNPVPKTTAGSKNPATPAPPATPDPNMRAGDVADTALPAGTGKGRRVVFSIEDQRVWLVGADNRPTDTYLVSGSVTDNLKPGTYDVFSRSRWAVGIDDSGVMEYFVRFTRGENAAIGFHSIPTKSGKALQTEAELGTPQSHGCIRQRLADAKRMWAFAPVGTEVVVI